MTQWHRVLSDAVQASISGPRYAFIAYEGWLIGRMNSIRLRLIGW